MTAQGLRAAVDHPAHVISAVADPRDAIKFDVDPIGAHSGRADDHYMMGGVPTNIHGQVVVLRTAIRTPSSKGSTAVGDALLDLLVFGRAAGNFIVDRSVPATAHKPLPADAGDLSLSRLARIDGATAGESVS